MHCRAGPLLFVFVTLFLSLTGARLSLSPRWPLFGSDTSYAENDFERTIQARAEHRILKREGESDVVPGAECAPADEPPNPPAKIVGQGRDQCLPFPGTEADGTPPPEKRSFTLWTRTLESVGLAERANGELRAHINAMNPAFVFPMNEATYRMFQPTRGNIRMDRDIATYQLCGCTTAIIASQYAVLMMHIPETRANDDGEYWKNPEGEAQKAADKVFIETYATPLLDEALAALPEPADSEGQKPTKENAWNGWFPASRVTISIVAPRWDHLQYRDTKYWFAGMEEKPDIMNSDWMYRQQFPDLVNLIRSRIGEVPKQFIGLSGYRRRVYGDDMFMKDDRDIVMVRPWRDPKDGKIYARMYYDDDKTKDIMLIAQPPPPQNQGSSSNQG